MLVKGAPWWRDMFRKTWSSLIFISCRVTYSEPSHHRSTPVLSHYWSGHIEHYQKLVKHSRSFEFLKIINFIVVKSIRFLPEKALLFYTTSVQERVRWITPVKQIPKQCIWVNKTRKSVIPNWRTAFTPANSSRCAVQNPSTPKRWHVLLPPMCPVWDCRGNGLSVCT